MKSRVYPNSPAPRGARTGLRHDRQPHNPATLILACILLGCTSAASAGNTPANPPPLDVAGDDMASEQAGRSFTFESPAQRDAQARLHDAVADNDGAAVRNELALGADPRVADANGCTPLHTAAALGALESARAILDEAVEGQSNSSSQVGPASGVSLLDMSFDQFVRRRDLLAARDADGSTPLHLAARGGFYDMVDLLLGYAAEVDPTDESEFTPLHIAALRNDEAVIALLLSRGADPTAHTRGGATPEELAKSPGARRRLADAVARIEQSPAWREARSSTERMLAAWRAGDADALRALMAPDTPGLHDIQLEPLAFDSAIDRISVRGFEAQVEGHLRAPSLDPPFQRQQFIVSLADIGNDWRITRVELQPGKGDQP